MTIEEQWALWQESNSLDDIPTVTEDQVRDALIKDLTEVSVMSVGEYTLYGKWLEVQNKYPTQTVNTLFGEETQLLDTTQQFLIDEVKSNIWRPSSNDDYMNLKPRLLYTDDSGVLKGKGVDGSDVESVIKRTKGMPEKWNTLRNFMSTMKNNSNIGRNLNFMVEDEVTGKYLGVICISSDFLDLTPRDQWIGWARENKTQGRMINYTAIGSTIVPTQPLGYNYVGGKLLALLCLSDTVQRLWKEQYGDTLIGVTTTSLYGKSKAGGLSQYDNLKHWKKMGYTAGSMAYEATKDTQYMIRHWLQRNHTRKYFEWYGAKNEAGQPYKRDHRNRSYHFAYSKLGIPKNLSSAPHARGIYFGPLYENSREFLRGEIAEDKLVKLFDTSEASLTELWKTKYAAKRIRSLVERDAVSDETLFYDDLIGMSWQDVKDKYLSQVGR